MTYRGLVLGILAQKRRRGPKKNLGSATCIQNGNWVKTVI